MNINAFTPIKNSLAIGLLAFISLLFVGAEIAHAQPPTLTPITTQNPKSGSYGIEGKITSAPPTQGAKIVAPSGTQSYSSSPITVSGSCPKGLLVEIYSNDVLVGSTMCQNGSFSVQVSLFPGQNELSALVVDEFGQKGPVSNLISVGYSNASFANFGTAITLTSAYGRRAADPGTELVWPLELSGGTGPYALSIDWGDGGEETLQSATFAGIINIKHTYKKAGIYRVTVKVTDSKGISGFLQLIAVANGAASSAIQTGQNNTTNLSSGDKAAKSKILWAPTAVALAFMLPVFWVGRRYEMRALRKRLERDAAMIQKLNV